MQKVSFWKVLGIIGTISAEVTEALADDGKVDATEIVEIAIKLIKSLDLDLGEENEKYLDVVVKGLQEIPAMIQDGKISAQEIIDFAEKVCADLGVDLDKEGISVPTGE